MGHWGAFYPVFIYFYNTNSVTSQVTNTNFFLEELLNVLLREKPDFLYSFSVSSYSLRERFSLYYRILAAWLPESLLL